MPARRKKAKLITPASDGPVGAMQGLLKTLGAVPIGGVELPPELTESQRGSAKRGAKRKGSTPKQRKVRGAAQGARHAKRERTGSRKQAKRR